MRNGIRAVALVGGTAAVVIGLAAPATFATTTTTTTWTVSPGGTWSGSQSGNFKLTDTTTGKSITCLDHATGSFKTGTGLRGARIGSITSLTFTSCKLPHGTVVTLTAGNVPWFLNAVTFKSSVKGGTTIGPVKGIHVTIAGTTCNATVDGSSATANDGSSLSHYHNSLVKLKIEPLQSNLHAYGVTGCTSVLNNGDPITFDGAYLVSPAQTITSP
jgi:hypothetical protein